MAYSIGWFSSGEVRSEAGREAARELLQAVMNAKEAGIMDIEMAFVFSNIEPGERNYGDEFFKLVEGYGIPLVRFSSTKFKPELRKRGKQKTTDYAAPANELQQWYYEYDSASLERLAQFTRPDLCVLAGDMTIWSQMKCESFDAINLHPALPWGPKGTWQSVIREMIREGATEHGVMMHRVTPQLDRGATVTYCRFPLTGDKYSRLRQQLQEKLKAKKLGRIIAEEGEREPLFAQMRADGVRRELPLVVYTIKQFADCVLLFRDGKLFEAETGNPIPEGFDITNIIDEVI